MEEDRLKILKERLERAKARLRYCDAKVRELEKLCREKEFLHISGTSGILKLRPEQLADLVRSCSGPLVRPPDATRWAISLIRNQPVSEKEERQE